MDGHVFLDERKRLSVDWTRWQAERGWFASGHTGMRKGKQAFIDWELSHSFPTTL